MNDIGTKKEHMAWAKARALEALEYYKDNPAQAFASLLSDLGKHSETRNHAALELGQRLLVAGHLSTPEKMRKFIEDFN